MSTDKLQKIMAAAGLGSRRAMEQWIIDGRVSINGKRASIGDRVAVSDKIIVDGKPMKRATHNAMIQCLLYHKPEGQICAVTDTKGRPTVFEALPELAEGRWISIGRLDFNTSGLLLFTNNGDLANKLMHPSANLTRRYMARIRGDLSLDDVKKITKKGVMLDGKPAKFEEVKVMDRLTPGANNWIEVSIKEGRYREVRRILEAVEHPVSRLKRTQYGTIKLTTSLKVGKIEKMAPLQLEKLLLSHGLDEFMPLVRKANQGKAAVAHKYSAKKTSSDKTKNDAREDSPSSGKNNRKHSKATSSQYKKSGSKNKPRADRISTSKGRPSTPKRAKR